MNKSVPTRVLRQHPDLEQLKRQAKELLNAFRSGDEEAGAEVAAHYRDANPATFALHDAQLVLARAYGFQSWAKLKAYTDGVTVKRLCDAVSADDMEKVRAMLKVRPELVNLHMAENNEQQALHFAVYSRSAPMVRLLMQHGANARIGIWPHRDATTPLTIATERGYDEIVQIIQEEEGARPGPHEDNDPNAWPAELVEVARSMDEDRVIAFFESHPELINVPYYKMAPLHGAAYHASDRLVTWFIDHGADVNLRDKDGPSPLELAGRSGQASAEQIAAIAVILLGRGAEMTARAAICLGDADWLRARHAEGALPKQLPAGQGDRGLLQVAVEYNRPEILKLLLELGLPPDEPVRKEGNQETGGPLRECIKAGRFEMAELLIERGATLTPAVAVALGKRDWIRAQHAAGKLENSAGEEGGLISASVKADRPEILELLLDLGFDPDERQRMDWMDADENMHSSGGPLRWCAGHGKLRMAEILLDRGADPNAWDYPGPPLWAALRERDDAMVKLLESRGAVYNPTSVGMLRDTERARKMFADYDAGRLDRTGFWERGNLAEEMLSSGADGGDPEIVRMALARIDWPRDDPRWWGPLGQPMGFYHEIPWIRSPKWPLDRSTYLECFRLILERSGPHLRADRFRQTPLHEVAAMGSWVTNDEVVQFATTLLDAGAKTDVRDDLLKSTPLGWACRWGRAKLVKVLLERGADLEEREAEPWATPVAWAKKMKHDEVLRLVRSV